LRSLHVGSYALPKILEIGLGPPGEIQILIPLPMGVLQQLLEVLLNLRGTVVLLLRISRG
jgi:hypothetical protein